MRAIKLIRDLIDEALALGKNFKNGIPEIEEIYDDNWEIQKEINIKMDSLTGHATKSKFGVVKIGEGINVNNGVISVDGSGGGGTVTSVNEQTPDENGNVTLTGEEIKSGYSPNATIKTELNNINNTFGSINMRIGSAESRITGTETRLTTVEEELSNHVDPEITNIHTALDSLGTSVRSSLTSTLSCASGTTYTVFSRTLTKGKYLIIGNLLANGDIAFTGTGVVNLASGRGADQSRSNTGFAICTAPEGGTTVNLRFASKAAQNLGTDGNFWGMTCIKIGG